MSGAPAKAFDYSALPPDVAEAARKVAERIRARLRHTAEEIVGIGRDLIETKEALGHGRFLPWIEAEFGMTDRTARNFMRVAETFKSETVPILPAKVLYELARPTTPEPVRLAVIQKAEAGEPVTQQTVRVMTQAAQQGTDCEEPAKITVPKGPVLAEMKSPAEPSNVIQLGQRLEVLPPGEEFELKAESAEAADAVLSREEFDLGNPAHRARAINGAITLCPRPCWNARRRTYPLRHKLRCLLCEARPWRAAAHSRAVARDCSR
jgi:hypothetical protein